jgi:hypothetical protein
MSAGPLLVDQLVAWFWPWGRRKLDALPHRRQIFLWLIVIGVFWSGFSAWREERNQRVAAETARDEARLQVAPASQANIRELQKQLDEAEDRRNRDVASLQGKLSDAESRTAQLGAALREQQAERLPRTITKEQHVTAVAFLRDGPKGAVFVVPALLDSSDAKSFSDHIKDVLLDAGFSIPENTGEMAILSYSKPGAWIWVKDVEQAPSHTIAIQRALRAIGITLLAYPDPKNRLDVNQLMICVSSHP